MNSISRSLAVTIVVYLMLALESPLLHTLQLSFFAPDLALIAVIWAALHMPTAAALATCFMAGFLKDGFVMGAPIGMHMEIFVVAFFVMRFFAGRLLVRGLPTLMVTTAILSIISTLLFTLLTVIFDRGFTNYGMLMRLMVPVALVTAPFAPLVFFLLDRVDSLFLRKGSDSVFFG